MSNIIDLSHVALGDAERVLRLLISTPSQNGIDPERAISEKIAAELEPLGFETELVPLAGDESRASVGARLRGTGGGPTLVINGHIDTVPAGELERWDADPFAGVVRDGEMIGRGTVDMKGGLAAQMLCGMILAKADRLPGDLVLHFAAGEERSEPGTTDLLAAGFTGDFGIVTEPTRLEVASVMRGMCAYRITMKGRSAHAANIEQGLNPVDALGPLLEALDKYDKELTERVKYPGLPDTRCSVTMIDAGFEQSSVPELCEVVVDRRLVPGETHQTGLNELKQIIAEVAAGNPEVSMSVEAMLWFEPCAVADDHPLVKALASAGSEVMGEAPPVVAVPYASDVTKLIHEGSMDAVQFGPGDIRLAHATNERVAIADVLNAGKVLAVAAADTLQANNQQKESS